METVHQRLRNFVSQSDGLQESTNDFPAKRGTTLEKGQASNRLERQHLVQLCTDVSRQKIGTKRSVCASA